MSIRRREKWYWFLGFQYRFPRRRIWVWLLVTAPISLVGAFLTIRDAVLPRVYGEVRIAEFLPSVYWYWHWYVIVALVYLIILLLFLAPAANRFTLERQRERSDEKLRRYKRQIERSLTTAGAPTDLSLDALKKTHELVPLQPNLKRPFDGAIESVHEGEDGVIARGHTENGNNFKAVVATYKNSPDTRLKRRIVAISGVAAEVSFIAYGGAPAVRPHYGAWLSEKGRKVDFEVSGRRDLIVATVEGDQVYTVERETTGIHPNGVTNRTALVGKLFKLKIRLIDSFGTILDDNEMILVISREPQFKIELQSARYWILFSLHDLFKEGHDLLMKASRVATRTQEQILARYETGSMEVADIRAQEREEQTPIATEAKEWEVRVGEFLGLHLGEDQKKAFLSTKPSIDDGLNYVRKHPFERLLKKPGEPEDLNFWTLGDSLRARWESFEKIRSNY